MGLGDAPPAENAWKNCPYEGAGEGRRLAKLRAAFAAGGQPQQLVQSGRSSQSRGARAQRAQRAQLLASTPVHRARAGRGAGRQTLTAYASGQIERVGVGARVGVNVICQTDSESQWRTSIGR